MVSGGAGLFQESLGGFRKGYVFHERLGGGFRKGVVVSGKSGVAPGKAAWFPGGLWSCRKDWVLVSGEAVRFQARPTPSITHTFRAFPEAAQSFLKPAPSRKPSKLS